MPRPKRKLSSSRSGKSKKNFSEMSPFIITGIVFASLSGISLLIGGVVYLLKSPTKKQAQEVAQTSNTNNHSEQATTKNKSSQQTLTFNSTPEKNSISKNNFKQIGLALHNYHDTHRTFPPGGTFDVLANKYHHSWMTMILPFVEHVPLYKSISIDHPWDASRNRNSFSTEVPRYLNPAINQTQVNGYGAAHYAGNSKLFYRNSQIRLRDITDGSSNTIMAGEVSSNIMAWGNPENIRNPANGLGGEPNGFGSPYKRDGEGGANILFADGRVQFISKKIDPAILKALGTPAGGEVPEDY